MNVKDLIQQQTFALLRFPGKGTKATCIVPSGSEQNSESFIFHPFDAQAKAVTIHGIPSIVELDQGNEVLPRPLVFPEADAGYVRMIENGINRIRAGEASKLVLSRKMEVKTGRSLNDILSDLAHNYPNAMVYAVSDPLCGTWFGATPEVLLRQNGDILKTMALAGTKSEVEQRPWTAKEVDEQHYVQQFIEDVIEKNKGIIRKKSSTYDSRAGNLLHLRTDFEFQCSAPVDSILKDLHPTPATCGLPKGEAIKIIGDLEQYNRQFYCGYLGLKNQEGAELFVNLRCGNISGNVVMLYAGGGITIDSNPEQEWIETCSKLNTLLAVL